MSDGSGLAQLRLRQSWYSHAGASFPARLLPQVEAYPRPLMRYTEELYRHAFGQYGDFRLRENGMLQASLTQVGRDLTPTFLYCELNERPLQQHFHVFYRLLLRGA